MPHPSVYEAACLRIDESLEKATRLKMKDTRGCLALASKALGQAQELSYARGQLEASYLVVMSHFVLANGHPVVTLLEQGRALSTALGDEVTLSRFENLTALVSERQGDPGAALEWHTKALERRRRIGDRAGEVGSLNNLGLFLGERGQHFEALEHLLQSLSLAHTIGDRVASGYAGMNCAQIFLHVGELEASRRYCSEALSSVTGSDDWALESSLHTLSGRIENQSGHYEAARAELRSALLLARKTRNQSDLGRVFLALGELHRDSQHAARAKTALTKALDIFRAIGDQAGRADALLALAQVAVTTAHPGDALTFAQKSLEICQSLQANTRTAKIHLLLSRLSETQGDAAAALAHFRLYHDLWKSTHYAEASRRVQKLMAHNPRLRHNPGILHQLAHDDSLTGVSNKRWLEQQLARELERSRRFGHSLSVLAVDLDHPSEQDLKAAGQILRDGVRSIDLVGRYGPRTFVVVLVETSLEKARLVAVKLETALEGLRVSFGVASDASPDVIAAALDDLAAAFDLQQS